MFYRPLTLCFVVQYIWYHTSSCLKRLVIDLLESCYCPDTSNAEKHLIVKAFGHETSIRRHGGAIIWAKRHTNVI